MGGRHHWRPALVGFVGFGGGFGAGFGGIGWVPLAPYEPFHPWYGRGFYGGFRNGSFHHGTVIKNVNITNVYRNARMANGVTNVRSADFGRGSVNHVSVDAGSYRSASMVRGALPVAPDRSSLRYSDAQTSLQSQAAGSRNNSFYSSRRSTGTPDRIPFEQQRSVISNAVGRTSGGAGAPAPRLSDPANAGGWRRFGDSTPRQTSAGASMGANRSTDSSTTNSGWDRFGNPGNTNSGVSRTSNSAPARRSSTGVYSSPSSGAYSSPRVSPPPVVRQSVPPASYGGGRSAAPAPSYGGGGRSAPAPSSGGHSSGGGGGGRSPGGGGGHSSGDRR